eukprot:3552610-Pyramimonas_sp.AAC.1
MVHVRALTQVYSATLARRNFSCVRAVELGLSLKLAWQACPQIEDSGGWGSPATSHQTHILETHSIQKYNWPTRRNHTKRGHVY